MYLAARPSLALRTLHVFIYLFFFAQPTNPPSGEGGQWEMKHFIGMAKLKVLCSFRQYPYRDTPLTGRIRILWGWARFCKTKQITQM